MVLPTQHLLLIPGRSLHSSPWKNGGGSTREIMIYPEHSDVQHFDWRVSIAAVEQEGSFSQFPDIDRHIMLLSGTSMVLHSDTTQHTLLPYQPYSFPGETSIYATLPHGSTTDFNLMVRRDRAQGTLQAWTEPYSGLLEAGHTLLHCAVGAHEIILGHASHRLEAGDTLWIRQPHEHQQVLKVQPQSTGNCLVYTHIHSLT